MRELSTKKDVIITTYTKEEIDRKMDEFIMSSDTEGCVIFLDDVKSFNKLSEYFLSDEEARLLAGEEDGGLYTNYKGCPLGLSNLSNVKLFYRDPMSSLKSAFEAVAPEFDYDNHFFHIKIDK